MNTGQEPAAECALLLGHSLEGKNKVDAFAMHVHFTRIALCCCGEIAGNQNTLGCITVLEIKAACDALQFAKASCDDLQKPAVNLCKARSCESLQSQL